MNTIYVTSGKAGLNEKGKEVYLPVGLSVPVGREYIPLDITAEMAEKEIAIPIAKNEFIQAKLKEGLIREIDPEKAKPKYKKWKEDFDSCQSKSAKNVRDNENFVSNVSRQVSKMIDRELKSKRSSEIKEDAE